MNIDERIKSMILKKFHHEIKSHKMESLKKSIRDHFPTKTMDEALSSLERLPDLPSWLKSAVTINETFFFRHPEQFDLVTDYFKSRKEEPLNILCLGVSSGEEAYSLYVALREAGFSHFKIVGIDADAEKIEVAKKGVYSQVSFQRVSGKYKDILVKYFSKKETPRGVVYEIHPEAKNFVRFNVGDIFKITFSDQDLIFCRNILIYFTEEHRTKLLKKIYSRIKPGGLLVLGAGEMFTSDFVEREKSISSSVLKKVA
ncbi:MAG: methyltransferase domain-containing protein [Bdellovibrio sp.]|nr:MAG: methyltransferase domain-containing protein [Bdellovibrio sp.]